MEQIIYAALGGAGGLAGLFVFGRRAFVKWTQESVQVNAAEAASAIVVMLRQQLDALHAETIALRKENTEFRRENAEFRSEIAELREEIRKLRGV